FDLCVRPAEHVFGAYAHRLEGGWVGLNEPPLRREDRDEDECLLEELPTDQCASQFARDSRANPFTHALRTIAQRSLVSHKAIGWGSTAVTSICNVRYTAWLIRLLLRRVGPLHLVLRARAGEDPPRRRVPWDGISTLGADSA